MTGSSIGAQAGRRGRRGGRAGRADVAAGSTAQAAAGDAAARPGSAVPTLGFLPLLAVSAAIAPVALDPAWAQSASGQGSGSGQVVLDPVDVQGTGDRQANVMRDKPSVARLPTTVLDTPQVVDVINEEQMEQRGMVSLRDVVRQVPGITLNAGEGGGGSQPGDNFNIRGFSANGNVYTDGLGDIGIYNRDVFNLEAVEVFKGSSGVIFGRGGGGGVINMATKRPQSSPFISGEATVGTDSYYRATADVNQVITDNIALRINAMAMTRDIAERDEVYAKRWAFAPSITFGMQSDTSLTLDYLHQHEHNLYDNGVPYAYGNSQFENGTAPMPVTEYGISRNNFYGYSDDKEKVDADVFTARFEHAFDENLTLWNSTRIGHVTHERSYVALASGATSWAPNGCIGVSLQNCFLNVATGGRNGASLHYARDKSVWSVENQTTLGAEFQTGMLSHDLRATLGILWEDHDQQDYTTTGPGVNLNLVDPAFGNSGQQFVESTNLKSRVTDPSVSLYDRVGFGYGIFAIGNVRYERYSLNARNYNAAGVETSSNDQTTGLWTWQAALEYKPVETQTYYVSVSQAQLPLYDPNLDYSSAPAPDTKPEEARTYEIGAKYSLLNQQLGLGLSLFHMERTNMQVQIQNAPGVTVLDGRRVVNGAEVQVDGRITDRLSINFGYAFLDSRVDDPTSPNNGNEMMRTPRHSGSAWLTYTPLDNVTLGGGATYVGRRYTAEDNTRYMPAQWQFDAVASYRPLDHVEFQLNAINLTNELTYDGTHAARHVQPGVGRTILLSTKLNF